MRNVKLWKSLLFVNSIISWVTTLNHLLQLADPVEFEMHDLLVAHRRSPALDLGAGEMLTDWLACLVTLRHLQIVLGPTVTKLLLSFVLLYEPHVKTYLAISSTGLVLSLHSVLYPIEPQRCKRSLL